MGYRLASPERKKGLDARAFRMLGWLALAVGIVGKTVIQSKMTPEDLESSTALLGIGFYCVETIGVPLFAYLLVEGFQHTRRVAYYFARVAGLAVLCMIPYNLAYSGNPWNFTTVNPVVGLVVAMLMLYLLRQYGGKSLKGIALSVLIVAVSMMWVKIFNVEHGLATVLLVATYWFCRKKQVLQVYVGAIVLVFCSFLNPSNPYTTEAQVFWNPYYIPGALGCLIVHFYNGEPDEGNRWINYLAYPAMLLGVWAFSTYAL